MKEIEAQATSTAERKEKIRNRYKGVDSDEIEVISAAPMDNINEDTGKERRVAAYCRVSTDDPNQTSSFELQRNHYTDYISQKPGWTFVDIYADEGISGTSLQHRDAFNRMIADCKEGKIDLIVTKSVSRFARNILDCIGIIRELNNLSHPVGVLFETEGIYTLDSKSEMLLSFMATLAQEESHTKSEIMNASIEMRFRRGVFLTPKLLGYDLDEGGNLVINEEEAKTVRLIFFMYLYGYTCTDIARKLTELGRETKLGNTEWNPTSVAEILQNERHCGDVIGRKTFTPNYLNHKSKKNINERTKYRQKDHHDAIISRDDFIAVQRLMANARYGNKGFLPDLRVVPSGSLKGFVTIHTKWSSFTPEDYICACESVFENIVDIVPQDNIDVEVDKGDFDLRGFQIARSQFFNTAKQMNVTFSFYDMHFSKTCVAKFPQSEYIELLLHPKEKLLAIRKSDKTNRYAVKWCRKSNGELFPRPISGAAFLKTIYELLEWNEKYQYRISGIRKQNETETVIIFNLTETEIFIPMEQIKMKNEGVDPDSVPELKPIVKTSKKVAAYPIQWADKFGNNVYFHSQSQELINFKKNGEWDINAETKVYKKNELENTGEEELEKEINNMISEMTEEE